MLGERAAVLKKRMARDLAFRREEEETETSHARRRRKSKPHGLCPTLPLRGFDDDAEVERKSLGLRGIFQESTRVSKRGYTLLNSRARQLP